MMHGDRDSQREKTQTTHAHQRQREYNVSHENQIEMIYLSSLPLSDTWS